jgi:hypothetical protein
VVEVLPALPLRRRRNDGEQQARDQRACAGQPPHLPQPVAGGSTREIEARRPEHPRAMDRYAEMLCGLADILSKNISDQLSRRKSNGPPPSCAALLRRLCRHPERLQISARFAGEKAPSTTTRQHEIK